MRANLLRVLVLALPLAGCASGPGGSAVSTSVVTTVATTTSIRPSVTTTTESAVTSASSAPTTTSTALTTSITTAAANPDDATRSTTTTSVAEVACPSFGSTAAVRSSPADDVVFGLVGASVRAGDHDCFERVVFEMRGDGPFPSWRVEELNGPFDDVEGPTLVVGARVQVWIAAANVVTDPSSPLGYRLAWSLEGSSDARAEWPGFTALRGVVFGSGGDEKDSSSFTIGLDVLRPFRVFTLADPPRLVVDIHAPD